jgi:hypothetical protein
VGSAFITLPRFPGQKLGIGGSIEERSKMLILSIPVHKPAARADPAARCDLELAILLILGCGRYNHG